MTGWWEGHQTSAGKTVNEYTAMNYSAVFRAVSLISGHTSRLPLHVYRRISDTDREMVRAHPLEALLNRRSSPYMRAKTLRETMQAYALTWGNGYAEVERDGADRPIGLHLIRPDRVRVEFDSAGNVVYRVTNFNKTDTILPQHNVLHIAGLGDGLCGYSIIRQARESIGLGLATEQYGATLFGNSSRPSGVITVPEHLEDQAAARLRADWERLHSGPENGQRVAVLESGADFKAISVPPEDAQFLQTRELQITEIARWFGLPPHKLQQLQYATYSNIEQQQIEFLLDCLGYWLTVWEDACMFTLLSEAEQQDYYMEHVTASLLKADIKSRYEAYNIARNGGWYSANDVLRKENENSIGAQGDIYLIPANFNSAQDVLEGKTKQQAPATAPIAEPVADPADKTDSLRKASADLCGVELGRLLRKESARAEHLAKQSGDYAERLRTFYGDFESEFRESIAPIVTLYQAQTGQTIDAADWAKRHAEQSQRQLIDAGPNYVTECVTSWSVQRMIEKELPAYATSA